MHSKVIIASLVFGMTVGLGGSLVKSSRISQSRTEDTVCNCHEHHEHAHEHERASLKKKEAVRSGGTSSGDARGLFLTRPNKSATFTGGDEHWYKFTAPYSGTFVFETSGSMDTEAGLYLTMNSTSYLKPGYDEGEDYNFKLSYWINKGETYYLKVWEYDGYAGNYQIWVAHTHDYTNPVYYSNYTHKMMCNCGAYQSKTLVVDNYMNGHGHEMIHCSDCDSWIEVIPSPHTHSYNQYIYNSNNYHRKMCSCGYNYLLAHTFDQSIYVPEDNVDVKHCSVCDAWMEFNHVHSYSYQSTGTAKHIGTCSCGATVTSNHTLTRFEEFNGHGINGYAWCDICDTSVACLGIYDGGSSSYYVAQNEQRGYVFEAPDSDSYVFESEHTSGDPYLDIYNLNQDNSLSYYDHADDEKGNRDFTKTIYLEAGERLVLMVHGWSYNAVTFTLFAHRSHVHSFGQWTYYNSTMHRRTCSCGTSEEQPHSFTIVEPYNDAYHKVSCICGASRLEQHTFDAYYPYGHGHNDMCFCTRCQQNIEFYPIYNGGSYEASLNDFDAKWFVFTAPENGTYEFRTSGDYDTVGYLYDEEYPTTPVLTDNNSGFDYNFMFTYTMIAGQTVFVKVVDIDESYNEFTMHVNKIHIHNFNIISPYDQTYHKKACECGSYTFWQHNFSIQWINGRQYKVCNDCGAVFLYDGTTPIPGN